MLRECSNVRRCHNLPHHGEYTVGKHSFDAAILLMVLHPDASTNLLKAVLVHDFGERWCGDLPAPVKWCDGEFAKRSAELEQRCIENIGLDFFSLLSPEERVWLKAVDSIDLLLWAKEQWAMGNQMVKLMIDNLTKFFERTEMPIAARRFVQNHEWFRTSDNLPGK